MNVPGIALPYLTSGGLGRFLFVLLFLVVLLGRRFGGLASLGSLFGKLVAFLSGSVGSFLGLLDRDDSGFHQRITMDSIARGDHLVGVKDRGADEACGSLLRAFPFAGFVIDQERMVRDPGLTIRQRTGHFGEDFGLFGLVRQSEVDPGRTTLLQRFGRAHGNHRADDLAEQGLLAGHLGLSLVHAALEQLGVEGPEDRPNEGPDEGVEQGDIFPLLVAEEEDQLLTPTAMTVVTLVADVVLVLVALGVLGSH